MEKFRKQFPSFSTLVILCCLALLALHKPAYSQEKGDSTKVHLIPEAIVSAKKTQAEIVPVQELSGKQLQRLSAHSVADAVRYFSGVQIKDYGGIGGLKTINIRSMGSHHVGVFYDGIEIGNAQNGVVDLGKFSLDNMEAISVYNGQKSSIFQPAKDFASASSIYMATRTPVFGPGKVTNLNIAIKGGSFETINPSLLWENRITDKISSSVSAEYMGTSGKYKFRYAKRDGYDTTEVRENGDVNALRIEGALFGKVHNGEWKAKVYYYNSERGYPGAAVREEPGKFRHQDRQWDDNLFVQASFRKRAGSSYSFLLNAKYAYDYLHYLSDPRLDETTMYVNNRYRQHQSYISAANLFSLIDWLSLSLSADFQWNTLSADLTGFVYPQRYTFLTAAAASVRRSKLNLQTSLLHTYVKDVTEKAGGSAGDKSEFTPTIIASYRPFNQKELTLRAFYKRVFRMPTFNDLYYTFIGNKYLKPEYTNQYNIGFTYGINPSKRLVRVELQTDFYYNQIQDKIIAMPTSNQFRWTMLNLGYVEIRGMDLALQTLWKFAGWDLSARLNYTYQKAQDFTDPQSKYNGGQIPYVPWHSGSAIIGAGFGKWNLNYSFIYTGERYESVANIPENHAQPWYTHDLSLSREIALKNAECRVTAEVNNLLNQPYEVVQWYPMPGINYKIKLNIML